jgi:hypothetical protein
MALTERQPMFVSLNVEVHGKNAVQLQIPRAVLQETIATLVQVDGVTWIGVTK